MTREYLNAAQLAELTPWSPDAIQKKVRRGEFVRGVHYFQPGGPRGQLLFKWSAIVALIEAQDAPVASAPLVPAGAEVHDVEEAASRLRRLLRSGA